MVTRLEHAPSGSAVSVVVRTVVAIAVLIPAVATSLLLCLNCAVAQTSTPTPMFPGGGGCGSPDTNCIPTLINGRWAALRRAADLGNSELACYDPANAVQSGGFLTLTLRRQAQTCYEASRTNAVQQSYTSDMIMSYPFNFLYGTVEARIKFGRGWPALWLLGGNAAAQTGCQLSNLVSAENIFTCNWDRDANDSAEIDIAEFYESNDGGAYDWAGHNMFSSGGHSCGQNMPSGNAISDFHVYSMTWKPGSVTFAVDGVPANCSHTGSAVPSHPMFIMINNTLSQSNNSVPPSFPQVTTVDYVKVTDTNGQVIFFDDFDGAPAPTSTATAPPATFTANATATGPRTATQTATGPQTGTQTATPPATATRTATMTPSATRTQTASATPSVTPPRSRAPSPSGGHSDARDPADPDASAVELGVKFTSDVNGQINGIRFYKSTTNTGTHVGTLWSSTGTQLATATFTNETASGWQQVNFAAPVAITAGTVYVASYHTTTGHYAGDNGYFAAAGFDHPPLHALRDGLNGGNGVYVYGARAFPTDTYQSTNYWVDVVFSQPAAATATSTATTGATATAPTASTATAAATTTTTGTSTPTTAPSATQTGATTATTTATPTRTPTARATQTATATLTGSPTPTTTTAPPLTSTPTQTPANVPVVDVSISADGTNAVTTAAFHTALAGELLLAFVSSDGPRSRAQTVTVSGAGLAWTLVRRANSQAGTSEIWQATAASPVTGTVTSTQARTGYDQSLTVVAIQGSDGVGASAAAGARSGAPTVSLVTAKTGSLAFGVGDDPENAIARALGANQVLQHQWVDPRVGDTFWVQRIIGSTGPAGSLVTLNDTAPTRDRWNFAAVEVTGTASP